MNIVGQDKLLNFITSNNISTIPRTILLEGENGSGKHTICNFISEVYKLELEDITSNLTYEKIEQISQWVIDRIIWLEEGKIIFEQV